MISTRLKIDLSGFDVALDDIKEGIREGVKDGGQPIKENMRSQHGPGAHAQDRYQNRTGNLTRSIHAAGEVSDMPITEMDDAVYGGAIATAPYAGAVEDLGYKFAEPAAQDEGVVNEVMDIMADRINKKL